MAFAFRVLHMFTVAFFGCSACSIRKPREHNTTGCGRGTAPTYARRNCEEQNHPLSENREKEADRLLVLAHEKHSHRRLFRISKFSQIDRCARLNQLSYRLQELVRQMSERFSIRPFIWRKPEEAPGNNSHFSTKLSIIVYLCSDKHVSLPSALSVGPVRPCYPSLRIRLGHRLCRVDFSWSKHRQTVRRTQQRRVHQTTAVGDGWLTCRKIDISYRRHSFNPRHSAHSERKFGFGSRTNEKRQHSCTFAIRTSTKSSLWAADGFGHSAVSSF